VTAQGAGVGDASVGARWALLRDDERWRIPGVSLLAGVVLPTGRPPEQAGDPLAAGATGAGALQLSGGVQVERTWGPWLATAYATLTARAPRQVNGVTSQLAPRLSTGVVGGFAWQSGAAWSFGVAYAAEGDAWMSGESVPGSGNRSLTLSTALQVRVLEEARAVLSAFAAPPVPSTSAGNPAYVGGSASCVLGWD
jgi:hypothetical protein